MARPKENFKRRSIKYAPYNRGAFARSLASQVDNQGNNMNLMTETGNGNYKVSKSERPMRHNLKDKDYHQNYSLNMPDDEQKQFKTGMPISEQKAWK